MKLLDKYLIRALILINLSVCLMSFAAGAIHPWALLIYHGCVFLFLFFVVFLLLIIVMIYIAKYIWNLIKFKNSMWMDLCKIFLCIVTIFGVFLGKHFFCFWGLRTHYLPVKDYAAIRSWADKVEIPQEDVPGDDFYYTKVINIPECVQKFHPENVSITKQDGIKKLLLSWDSGLTGIDCGLIIYPVNAKYKISLAPACLEKIEPDVYLYYYGL